MCAGSSSHPVPRLSGMFACKVRSKSNHEILGIKPTDQSCHNEVWIHLLHVNAWLVDRASRDGQYRRPIDRKRKSYDRCGITWPSTPENHVAIRARIRDNSRTPPDAMCPPRCSVPLLFVVSVTRRRTPERELSILRDGDTSAPYSSVPCAKRCPSKARQTDKETREEENGDEWLVQAPPCGWCFVEASIPVQVTKGSSWTEHARVGTKVWDPS